MCELSISKQQEIWYTTIVYLNSLTRKTNHMLRPHTSIYQGCAFLYRKIEVCDAYYHVSLVSWSHCVQEPLGLSFNDAFNCKAVIINIWSIGEEFIVNTVAMSWRFNQLS
jgi:hypothetical protein